MLQLTLYIREADPDTKQEFARKFGVPLINSETGSAITCGVSKK